MEAVGKEEKHSSKIYYAECAVTFLLAGYFVFASRNYINPLFSLFLVLLGALSLSLINSRKIASVANFYFTFIAFSCGFGNISDMWANKYVFLPGIILLVVYGVLTILYRENKLKRWMYFVIGITAATGAAIFEMVKYRIPDTVFTYFAEHPLSLKSVLTWFTIASQGSLGFIVPAIGMALVLTFAAKDARSEKILCLSGAAILALCCGLFGFFGYKDIASPLLLLTVVIVSGLNEGLKNPWGRLVQVFTIGCPLFFLFREFVNIVLWEGL